MLPVKLDADIVTLGEGLTPLLPAPRLAAKHDLAKLLIKDESLNPTQSFKARGMSTAVSMAKQFGLKKLAATYAVLKHQLAAKTIRPDESVVLFNTGAGVKYLECFGG